MGLLLNTHMLPCQIAPIAHNKKTCVCESRRCYILFEWLLIGLSEYNAGSICRHGVEQIQKTEKEQDSSGRVWGDEGSLRWLSRRGLWIKDESFWLGSKFFLLSRGSSQLLRRRTEASKYAVKSRCGALQEVFKYMEDTDWHFRKESHRNTLQLNLHFVSRCAERENGVTERFDRSRPESDGLAAD